MKKQSGQFFGKTKQIKRGSRKINMNPLSLSDLESMSWNQRWSLIDSDAVSAKPWNSPIKTCQPHYIGPLYTNTPMPHYIQKDGTSILLEKKNVYNGMLNDQDRTDSVIMHWKGYTCQLYDGELKMQPIAPNSYIEGVCNGIAFKFNGTELEYGVWPGFLLLYKKK